MNEKRIYRTGLLLTALAASLMLYSFWVIRARGREAEPANLTRAQWIFRGL